MAKGGALLARSNQKKRKRSEVHWGEATSAEGRVTSKRGRSNREERGAADA